MTATRTWISQNNQMAVLLMKTMILEANWWRRYTKSTSCTLSKTSRPSAISCRWSRMPNLPFLKLTESYWTSGKPSLNHFWVKIRSNSKIKLANLARDSNAWLKIARIHQLIFNRSKTFRWESLNSWTYMPICTMLVPRLARSSEESWK